MCEGAPFAITLVPSTPPFSLPSLHPALPWPPPPHLAVAVRPPSSARYTEDTFPRPFGARVARGHAANLSARATQTLNERRRGQREIFASRATIFRRSEQAENPHRGNVKAPFEPESASFVPTARRAPPFTSVLSPFFRVFIARRS